MKLNYKRMLQGMQKKERKLKKRSVAAEPADPWILYILKCQDGTFYTGIAKDVDKRLEAHNKGTGAKYTRTRRPVRLLYQEACHSRSAALVRECAIKALPRHKKADLCTKAPGIS